MWEIDRRRPRTSYFDALAAIGLMKGVPMIDVARDDALISALMAMDLHSVHRIVERYDRFSLGYPTPETVARVAAECGLVPQKPEPPPEPERGPTPLPVPEPTPHTFVQVHTVSAQLAGLVWAVLTGVATTLAVGWLTASPWLYRLLNWLNDLLVS